MSNDTPRIEVHHCPQSIARETTCQRKICANLRKPLVTSPVWQKVDCLICFDVGIFRATGKFEDAQSELVELHALRDNAYHEAEVKP